MSEITNPKLNRRDFVQGAASGVALASVPGLVRAAGSPLDADKAAVLAQVAPMHAPTRRPDGSLELDRGRPQLPQARSTWRSWP